MPLRSNESVIYSWRCRLSCDILKMDFIQFLYRVDNLCHEQCDVCFKKSLHWQLISITIISEIIIITGLNRIFDILTKDMHLQSKYWGRSYHNNNNNNNNKNKVIIIVIINVHLLLFMYCFIQYYYCYLFKSV